MAYKKEDFNLIDWLTEDDEDRKYWHGAAENMDSELLQEHIVKEFCEANEEFDEESCREFIGEDELEGAADALIDDVNFLPPC